MEQEIQNLLEENEIFEERIHALEQLLSTGNKSSGDYIGIQRPVTESDRSAILSVVGSTTSSTSTGYTAFGDGSDGALSITSGATNIDCASARVVVKQYTELSITGTGSLTFTNPHSNGTVVVLLCTGNVTLTSSAAPMIDMSGMGGAGGAGQTTAPGTSKSGLSGTNGEALIFLSNAGSGSTTGPFVGSKGAPSTTTKFVNQTTFLYARYPDVFTGAGGASSLIFDSGSGGTIASAAGGLGGGGLIIECGGTYTFTTAGGISVAGDAGGNASGSGGLNHAGGSGGGAGGYCSVGYKTAGTITGTITVSGGTGGNCFNTTGTAYGGGGGSNPVNQGTDGTTSAVSGTKTGGDGGAGFSRTIKL